jgi:antitoxin (DNA-binding transcriptional repressor) of toxin-antitoxin stability system
MSDHIVAEARAHLPDLIDRALTGETVVITRQGKPVVELRAAPGRDAIDDRRDEALSFLAAYRVRRIGLAPDSGALLSAMRDDDWK